MTGFIGDPIEWRPAAPAPLKPPRRGKCPPAVDWESKCIKLLKDNPDIVATLLEKIK